METIIDYRTALAKGQRIAVRGEISSSDMAEKLHHWGLPVEQIAEAIKQLTDEKFLDNQRFANAFVKDKTRFNHWGRIKTTMLLKHKHITPAQINTAFDELGKEAYVSVFRAEMKKKDQTLKKLQPFDRNKKLANYLLSKGFEPELVFGSLKKID